MFENIWDRRKNHLVQLICKTGSIHIQGSFQVSFKFSWPESFGQKNYIKQKKNCVFGAYQASKMGIQKGHLLNQLAKQICDLRGIQHIHTRFYKKPQKYFKLVYEKHRNVNHPPYTKQWYNLLGVTGRVWKYPTVDENMKR